MAYAVWHGVITDLQGNVVPGAQVEVRSEVTGALVRLYEDRDGAAFKTNPFQADGQGQASFFATGGAYRIIARSGTFERVWRYVGIGTAQEADVEALGMYLQAGLVTVQTKAALTAVVPDSYPMGGVVLADPVGANNGYYTNQGSGWVFARPLPDTFARLYVTGGTANAVQATLDAGVNPSAPSVFFIDVETPNTGPVTITINGANTGPVLNVAGNPLAAGEWQGRILFTRESNGDYKIVLNDPASALSAALSATQAGDARDAAQAARAGAEDAKDDAAASAAAAATSESNASASASNAATSESNAAASEAAAAGSASTASSAATTATTQAANAASSASDAATSEANAAASEAAAGLHADRSENEADRSEAEANRAEAAASSISNPVSYNAQSPSSAEQAQARLNLGITDDANFVQEQDSVTAAQAESFKSSANWLRTAGFASPGDGGGALYKRVTSEPSHAGKFQSANGAWWELASPTVTPAMFGAKGDGTTDDTTALNKTLAMSGRGLTLDWGGPDRIYRITAGLTVTAAKDMAWRSTGATILLDSSAPISRVVDVNSSAYHFFCEGRLVINGSNKAYQGFVVTNGANAAKPSCRVNGISVKNIYRSGTTFIGGDGIFIQGNFSRIIVDDVHVETVKMAAAAGVPLSYGVTGISILRNFTPAADTDFISLTNFTVKDVYCEDVAYKLDQDGVRIFHDYSANSFLRPCSAFVSRGRIENAHGRAIKMQTEHCSISDVLIVRNGRIYGSGYVGNPEIDLQVGGGHLSNIDCQYQHNVPDRIAQFTPPQVSGRIINPHWTIKGVTIVAYGTAPDFLRLFSVGTTMSAFSDWYSINISDVHLSGKGTGNVLSTNFAIANARYLVTLTGIFAREVSNGWVLIGGDQKDTAFVYLTGTGLVKPQSPAVPFFGGTTTARVTAVLTGANVYVTPVT